MNCIYCNAIPLLPEEEFRPIHGFDGKYLASDSGRILKHSPRGKRKCGLLSAWKTRLGYECVSLIWDGKMKSHLVHRLIASAFLGPAPVGNQVNHIDGIKTSNAILNLEYCTPSENVRHAFRLGLRKSGDLHHSRLRPENLARGDRNGARVHPEMLARGERHGSARLNEAMVREIKRLNQSGISSREIAKRFSVGKSTILRVIRRETWTHVC